MSQSLSEWQRDKRLETTEDLQWCLLDVCKHLQKDLSCDGAGIAAAGNRLLASIDWHWPLATGESVHVVSAGPRANFLLITRGQPTFEERAGAHAEPALALFAACSFVASTLDSFRAKSLQNRQFVDGVG
jgi:hypothetical protein